MNGFRVSGQTLVLLPEQEQKPAKSKISPRQLHPHLHMAAAFFSRIQKHRLKRREKFGVALEKQVGINVSKQMKRIIRVAQVAEMIKTLRFAQLSVQKRIRPGQMSKSMGADAISLFARHISWPANHLQTFLSMLELCRPRLPGVKAAQCMTKTGKY